MALVLGVAIRELTTSKFAVIKSSQAVGVVEEIDFAKTENSQTENNGKININTATREELIGLYGIGDKLADRIIDYRVENGNFETIYDIMKVSGIGEGKFSRIKDNITVE